MDNSINNSYDELSIIKASDIRDLVGECLATKTNLLIYSEPGCGKSTIIEAMADEYFVVQLGAASLCEEMINGIPVHNAATNTINYDKPDWLIRIQANFESDPNKPQILFIDELTLARPEVMNSLQLLLTARSVPTHPNDKLPDNVVIVSATNTAEDTTEGCELSRPLKTRFITVRMTNTPSDYKQYVMGIASDVMPDIEKLLGTERLEKFVSDTINDASEHWCDNTKFYGTNPRTLMNYFKVCNYRAKVAENFTPRMADEISKRTIGHGIVTTNWANLSGENVSKVVVPQERKDNLPTTQDILMITDVDELNALRRQILNSPKGTTKKAVEAVIKINQRVIELNKENN